MKVKNLSMYGSHVPILAKVLEHSEGEVLDLGMGLSTIVMDMMCKLKKRHITSYETDPEWYQANTIYQSDFHDIIYVPTWEEAKIEGKHWSVALIDHAPAKQRIKEVKRLANICDFVMIHDSEPVSDKYFKYRWVYPLFKYRYDYTACLPNTTVLSNFIDLSFLK